ncbi:aminoacyl-tRNA hydrolase [bacterium]|nr:MAG: aminoacyl-tRNA hydrolase [bacterium]
MKLIVGLGNPGLIYAGSRHNIGFSVIKSLARSLKASLKRDRSVFSITGACVLGRQSIILAMPQTFMNLSGIAVKALLKKYRQLPENLLVICDDLDLEPGRIKLRGSGTSGGQRGLESIIEHTGTREFPRLRIGIGRPPRSTDAAGYVLTGFSRREKPLFDEAREKAVECALSWVEKGTVETMNMFNAKGALKNE